MLYFAKSKLNIFESLFILSWPFTWARNSKPFIAQQNTYYFNLLSFLFAECHSNILFNWNLVFQVVCSSTFISTLKAAREQTKWNKTWNLQKETSWKEYKWSIKYVTLHKIQRNKVRHYWNITLPREVSIFTMCQIELSSATLKSVCVHVGGGHKYKQIFTWGRDLRKLKIIYNFCTAIVVKSLVKHKKQ